MPIALKDITNSSKMVEKLKDALLIKVVKQIVLYLVLQLVYHHKSSA